MKLLSKQERNIHVAFSGGSTPAEFFDCLAKQQNDPGFKTDWSRINIWWVDERCVPHDHPESNYGMTHSHLLRFLPKAHLHVHPVQDHPPEEESLRYAQEIRRTMSMPAGIPEFDWIFLGMGEDGHTASIFPDRLDLLDEARLCAPAVHPVTGQFRVTMTGNLILAAKRLSFMITGANKASVVKMIIEKEAGATKFPAFHIAGRRNQIDWFLDDAAAQSIKHLCCD